MTRHKLLAAVAIVAALHSGFAKASIIDIDFDLITDGPVSSVASKPDVPAPVAGRGCTVYEHANATGEAWHIPVGWQNSVFTDQTSYAEVLPTLGDWWNDRISSFECFDDGVVRCSISFHVDADRRGQDAILWGSQGLVNLVDWGFDDVTSSLAVFCSHLHG